MSMPKYRIIIDGKTSPIIPSFKKLKIIYAEHIAKKENVEVTSGTNIITGLMEEVIKNAKKS